MQDILNLTRVDVESTADDHVFLAVDDIDEAFFILKGDIARMEPAITDVSAVASGLFR